MCTFQTIPSTLIYSCMFSILFSTMVIVRSCGLQGGKMILRSLIGQRYRWQRKWLEKMVNCLREESVIPEYMTLRTNPHLLQSRPCSKYTTSILHNIIGGKSIYAFFLLKVMQIYNCNVVFYLIFSNIYFQKFVTSEILFICFLIVENQIFYLSHRNKSNGQLNTEQITSLLKRSMTQGKPCSL